MMNAADFRVQNPEVLRHLGRYFCRKWNWPTGPNFGDKRIVTFDIVVYEVLTIEFERRHLPQPPGQFHIISSHLCDIKEEKLAEELITIQESRNRSAILPEIALNPSRLIKW